MNKTKTTTSRILAGILTMVMLLALMPGFTVQTQAASAGISNDSLSVTIGDLGQIEVLNIVNNPTNSQGNNVNFVLPNNTSPQNGVQHQWMGEMIFSTRSADTIDGLTGDFVEVDTNKTLAAGGSTTYSNATDNLDSNPYINKNVVSDKKVEIDFIGQDIDSTTARAMKGFDVKSTFDMDTDDGSLLWEITLTNKSSKYIEFGDVGLPMPWNNKYTGVNDTYRNRVTAHTFAGADSGYAYAVRCSGEGNYMLFTPVPESGARIEYIEHWQGSNNGVSHYRTGSTFTNWTGDSGSWQPGLSVYYLHSKDIRTKTGSGYFTDSSSLVLAPGESETYQLKFAAIRAGDNSPQESAGSPNNASNSVEEREANMRSILYDLGMIDAVAVPSFQTAINMPAKLDLHYDSSLVTDVNVQIQCVHENDPFDAEHIPNQTTGLVNNSRAGRGLHDGNPDYTESCTFAETKVVDGEEHHIYDISFGCIGNNSVRVDYKLNGEDKFTQFEFNVLTEIDKAVDLHAEFMLENQHEATDVESDFYGTYYDWYLSSGRDTNMRHWADDWSHDNVNFMAMKNYLNPDAEQVESLERYLIDFLWNNPAIMDQSSYNVKNTITGSYLQYRDFSKIMAVTGFFNMYRIQKTYPELMEYRESPQFYLEKAYGIYYNQIGTSTGVYGEQQIPDIIEALYAEGMTTEGDNLKQKFAYTKGRNMANTQYPYGSEFVYDNTGEEGIYAAVKALLIYYPEDSASANAEAKLAFTDMKTRAMRGIQPTWYHYADPVFLGGEGWWNFQYTASLAGSIMDDNIRYMNEDWDNDQRAWANRLSYGAKISNFNAINMGQISADSIGSVAWRYTMFKGGGGAMNVNDGGTRVMNNGWNDFSGEADEGLYGSLLRISSDVVTDPVFGLFGYGSEVSKAGGVYTIVPRDGVGKRINLLDEKIYVELVQDKCAEANIAANDASFELDLVNLTEAAHVSRINLSGTGLQNGYYDVKLNGEAVGQCFVKDNTGTVSVPLTDAATANVTIEKKDSGSNQAPTVSITLSNDEPQAVVPFTLIGNAVDDGAPEGALAYSWEVVSAPAGASLTLDAANSSTTKAVGTKEGAYVVKLTVSDGELTGSSELSFALAAAPERLAPTIGNVTAVQGAVNSSIVTLTGEAEADPLYNSELDYEWSIVSQPGGSNATLGNTGEATAYLLAAEAGSYTIRFTATDADVSAYEDITFEVTAAADGIQRAVSVVTQKGAAPTLPAAMDVVYPDGSYGRGAITWDAVDASQYAAKGQFEATGIIEGTSIPVAAIVHVVDGTAANNALVATPTAVINTPQDLGGVTKMNDGIDPTRSSDTSNGVWHNWLGNQSGPAWVQYDWDEAFLATAMDVYVFRDGGGNFQPKDMQVTLRDENGNWYTPRAVNGLGNTLNQYNNTAFEPAYITGIRIDMNPVTLGCGIIEWKVYGFSDAPMVDKTALRNAYTVVDGLRAAQFVGGLDVTSEAKTAANAVLNRSSATQEEVDAALAALLESMRGLKPLNGNLAYMGGRSASFTSSWESLPSINDGLMATSSAHWGTWGNAGATEWVQYTWPQGVTVGVTDLVLWANEDRGIQAPRQYVYQYIPADSAEDTWVTAATITTGINCVIGTPADSHNVTQFDEPFQARALRVTLTKQSSGSSPGVGMWEWEVYASMKANTDALQALYDLVKDTENDGAYTTDSWTALEEALAAAETVLADDEANQEAVDEAYDALNKACDDLAARALDYELAILGSFVTLYEGYVEAMYTPESWAVLQDAISVATALIADPANASSTAVNEAIIDLIDAGNNLAPSLSKSPLEGAISDAEALLAEGNWIPASAENLQKVIDKAKALLDKEDLTQAEMVDMILELNDVMSHMFEVGNKASLQLLVNTANRLEADLFTTDSWTIFSAAMTAAQKVLDDANATADEVVAAYNSLSDAIRQLVAKANFSGLKTAIDLANTILANADKYVPASIEGLQAEADKAQLVYDNTNATQSEVDAAQAALMAKILGARKPANKEALKSSLGRSSLAGQMSQAGTEALNEAVAKAEQIAGDPAATQEAVDEAVKAVEQAALAPVIAAVEVPENAPAAPYATGDADIASPDAGTSPAEEALPAAPGNGDVEENIPGEASAAPQAATNTFVLWIVAGSLLLLAAVAVLLLKKRGSKEHQPK